MPGKISPPDDLGEQIIKARKRFIKAQQQLSPEATIKKNKQTLIAFVVVVFTSVIVYKIGITNFDKVLSTFDFSDLLSLAMSMFSVAIAILFFFKANDTANTFYDNTYRFTSQVSETLGRVEATFGEKIASLDKTTQSNFDNLRITQSPYHKNAEEIESEKKELVEEIEILKNENIQNAKKTELMLTEFAVSEEIDQEKIDGLRQQLEIEISQRQKTENQILDLERDYKKVTNKRGFSILSKLSNLSVDALNFVVSHTRAEFAFEEDFKKRYNAVSNLIEQLPPDLIDSLREDGVLLNKSNELTNLGRHVVEDIHNYFYNPKE